MATNSGNRPSSHPFTCNTCQVAFRTSEAQRGHMQSDWHRYNLKRRIASLPPISSEIFAEKVLANKASQAAVAAKASFTRECPACHKTYFSENAYTNHLASQRHRQNELRMRAGSVGDSMMSSAFSITGDTDTTSVVSAATAREERADPDAEDEFAKVVEAIKESSLEDGGVELPTRRPSRPHHSAGPDEQRPEHPLSSEQAKSATSGSGTTKLDPLLNCLFCNIYSTTVESNVLHMQKDHGMFIPEKNYLADLQGLLVYLHEKVTILNECLYCGVQKRSTEACQTHMLDKGHCMIAFGTEDEQLEIGEFYDFRATYSDGEGDSDEDDDAASEASWETASVSSGDSDADIPEVDETEKTRRALLRAATARGPKAVYFDDVEMHLGSGRSVGHRSWNRVWRQRLATRHNPVDDATQGALVNGDGDSEMGNRAGSDGEAGALTRREKRDELFGRGRQGRPSDALITRADGGAGMLGVTAQKREEVRAEEKRSRRTEQRLENKFRAVREKKGNFQKHYRDHLLQ